MRLLLFTAVLGALWYSLSGHTEPLLLGFAVVSLAIVALVSARMRIVDAEGFPIQIVFRAVAYSVWLGVQILLSSLAVARLALQPRLKIRPRMITLPMRQKTELGRAIYANSITATPGTVCVNVYEDRVVIHALTQEAADQLAAGEMDARVRVVAEGRGS